MAFRKSSKSFPKLGGERTDKALTDFKDYEAVIAKNVRFDKLGRVRTRKGGEKYNDTQMGSATSILGLHHFKYGVSGSQFLECWNQYIYKDDGTTRTQIKSGQNSSAYYSFVNFDDFCWINNGVNAMLKYDGTTVTNACLTAPSVGAFSAADSGVAGNVNGSVCYLATFRVTSTGQESNAFVLASAPTVSVTNKQVDLTDIPVSADTQVDQRRIYRTTDGGSVYDAQLVTEINDNVTTTYTDNTLDANLGALISLDHDTAPVMQKVIVHRNRGFGFAPNSSTLYFTIVNNLWYWPQGQVDLSTTQKLYYLHVNPDDGDCITNIVSYGENVLIFKNNARYILRGFDETEFQIDPIVDDERVGCVSFRAAKVAGGVCYFMDASGIYMTDGNTTKPVSALEGFFDPDNSNTEEKINKAYLSNVVAEVNSRKPYHFVQFSCSTGTSVTNNFHLLVDYLTGQCSHDTGYIAQSLAVRESSNQDYFMRGDDYGFIWTMDTMEGDGGLIYSTSTGSNTPTTLNDTTLSMTVNEYAGAYIEGLDGLAEGERFRVLSNTATEFTIDGTWIVTPDGMSVYAVGGIDFDYQNKWDDYDRPPMTKRLNYIRTRYDTTGNYSATTYFLWDFQSALSESSAVMFTGIDLTLWDVGLWDVGLWDAVSIIQEKIRPPSGHVHRWGSVRWNHKIPGQPIIINSFDKVFQVRVPR